MMCKLEDLKNKTVVNIKNGANLGFVDDVVIDSVSAKVVYIVIYGKKRFFGLFGREEDVLVAWEDITIIGDDVVLVSADFLQNSNGLSKKKSFFKSFFR